MPGIPSPLYEEKSVTKEIGSIKRPNISLKRKIFTFCIFLVGLFSLFYLYPKEEEEQLVYLKGQHADFVGRKKYLSILYNDLLKKPSESVKIKVLWGKGGYGKSELAIAFGNQFFSNFSLIWTFYCDTEEHMNQGYRDLADKLGINPSDSLEKIKEDIRLYLENHSFKRPWLLIFDNVEKEFTDFPERGGVILVTSQKKIFNPKYLLEIEPLSQSESLELLNRITHEQPGVAMEELAKDLEGIPLLINYAAHFIEATPGCDVAQYQRLFSTHLFEKEGHFWKDLDVNQRYSKSLATSWQFPLKSLKEEHPLALQWLYICSYLYPEHIPEVWIDDWLEQNTNLRDHSLQIERQEILKALQTFGIIRYEKETKTLSIHRFFQCLLRENREDLLSQVIQMLSKHAGDFKFSDLTSWKQSELWYAHASEVMRFIDRLPLSQQPKSIPFYEGIKNICHFNEYFHEALKMDLKILAILEKSAPERGKIFQSLGFTYIKLGCFEEALTACTKAENLLKNSNTLDGALILSTKGKIFYCQGRYAEALKQYEQALEIREKILPSNHIEIGRNLFHISRCLNQLGRNEEMLQLQNQIEQIYEKSCGKNHPFYAWSLEVKARALGRLGHFGKALKIFKQSLKILQSSLGYKDIVYSWDGIGWCYYNMKKYKQAKKGFKNGCRGSKKWPSPSGEVRSYKGLAMVYLQEKRFELGIKYLLLWFKPRYEIYKNTPKLEATLEFVRQVIQESHVETSQILKICEEVLGQNHSFNELLSKPV